MRFSECTGISPRTGKALKPASKIKEHILMNQHTGMLDDFTTLLGDDNELPEIKKCIIMIKTLKPTLKSTQSKVADSQIDLKGMHDKC